MWPKYNLVMVTKSASKIQKVSHLQHDGTSDSFKLHPTVGHLNNLYEGSILFDKIRLRLN